MKEKNFREEELIKLGQELFLKGGLKEEDAFTIAKDLAAADLRGLYSHGVSRIPMYLKRIDCKCVNPRPDIKAEQVAPAALRVNGDDGMGFLVAHKAVEAGIELAEKTGIAMVGCTHSTHFGMAALYVKQAVDAGYCCMVYTNSSPALPVHGGRTSFLGAAPFAAGMPGGYESPAYVLDMAMTKTARGKIRVAMINNEPIPEGLALDSKGNPTTDAKKAFEGVCLPFGGPKGAGLAMLMDMIAGMYTGSNYAGDVSSLYYRFDEPQNLGHMIFIMKSDLFMNLDDYKKKMDIYYKRLKALPRAAGCDEILMPGEPEDRKTEENRKNGILLSGNIQESLYMECMKRGVDCSGILGEMNIDCGHNAGEVVFEQR
ncbi:Ldh family oxidoreductase [Clostridium sp. Marseille-P2415]|uniref:Ldh family oxidoreductase n=1 Tax=Clostridium sp. Marseille-P2415 TaxID=1805471 RepID=UPI000988586C|nr:Ldh family oxidoreductase [Clostridium sp. Marseille-P2415]